MMLRAWFAPLLGLPLAAMAPVSARAGAPPRFERGFELSVLVDGVPAPEYSARGRIYVEALRGREFTLRLRNPSAERVAVALSVDGRNVIDAKRSTAGRAAKWVLGPDETIDIPGWQVSGQTSRRFYFTETPSSYANWLGDTRNAGLIEAVFFRELRPVISGEAVRPESRRESDQPVGGTVGERESLSPPMARPAEAPSSGAEKKALEQREDPSRAADEFAATGIGDRTWFPVRWVEFREDPRPIGKVEIRYEFRRELARLGIIPPVDGLSARERARGFEPEYAPDPYRHR